MCAARLRSQIVVVAAAVLAAIGMGAAAASVPFNALILAFALLAVLIGAWLLGDVKRALVLLVGVIALLPRFASPVSIGFKPTFLDIALVGLLLAWSMAQRDGQRLYPLRGHPIVTPVAAVMRSLETIPSIRRNSKLSIVRRASAATSTVRY